MRIYSKATEQFEHNVTSMFASAGFNLQETLAECRKVYPVEPSHIGIDKTHIPPTQTLTSYLSSLSVLGAIFSPHLVFITTFLPISDNLSSTTST